jgi:hypothetical protein
MTEESNMKPTHRPLSREECRDKLLDTMTDGLTPTWVWMAAMLDLLTGLGWAEAQERKREGRPREIVYALLPGYYEAAAYVPGRERLEKAKERELEEYRGMGE